MQTVSPALQKKYPVAVIGARGYSGLELSRLLLCHPVAALAAYSASAPFSLADELPQDEAAAVPFCTTEQLLELSAVGKIQTVFLATPAEISLELAPKFLASGSHVIDLSGAFRLKSGGIGAYERWYRMKHDQPVWLAKAIYGLRPWAPKVVATEPTLVANPGCYATAVSMALLPLLQTGLLNLESIVIDAKSGTTGGGRKASEDLLLSEAADECRPYKVGAHQHLPEINETAMLFAGSKIDPMFTTHLLPVRRGIVASMYCQFAGHILAPSGAAAGARVSDSALEEKVGAALSEFYGAYPLLQHAPFSSSRAKMLSSLKSVCGTPFTFLTYKVSDGRLYLFANLDNLLKGAASQAVENWNIITGQAVEAGLLNTIRRSP
jgi:N-acetyl-gamma-glutamyl-phosphate reductase